MRGVELLYLLFAHAVQLETAINSLAQKFEFKYMYLIPFEKWPVTIAWDEPPCVRFNLSFHCSAHTPTELHAGTNMSVTLSDS